MLHTLQADQAACELLHSARRSVHNEYFQAEIMIKMGVSCRNDQVMTGVLQFCKLLGHSLGVKVINQRDAADDSGVGNCRAF